MDKTEAEKIQENRKESLRLLLKKRRQLLASLAICENDLKEQGCKYWNHKGIRGTPRFETLEQELN